MQSCGQFHLRSGLPYNGFHWNLQATLLKTYISKCSYFLNFKRLQLNKDKRHGFLFPIMSNN